MNDSRPKKEPAAESHGTEAAEAALERAYEAARAYLKSARGQSTYVPVTQPEIRKRLGTRLPEKGEPSEAVIASLIEASQGALAPTMGGRFFAYVIGGTHPAGVASEFLNAAWDDKPGTPLVTPFGCAIDGLVGEWVLELLDLPRESSVGIVTGGSLANFLGIAAARHALLKREGWDVEAQGLFGAPPITVLISEEEHPTVLKALRLAGLGAAHTRPIGTDAQGAMRADRVEAALGSAKGPVLVCSQAGNINTGAMDPFAEIAPLCRARGAWLHVDGAFGLWARVSPELAGPIRGVELADSWATDAHKMLNTPYDAGFGIVRDAAAHLGAMDISASYLVQAEGARDPSRYVPELSRRARGTPVYATIRALGRQGVREMIEGCCANARRMRDLLTARDGVTCLNDVVFNQALFRFAAPGRGGDEAAGDALTVAVATRVRESGECWVQSSEWRGREVMRFSVADRATTPADIDRAAAAVLKAYDEETRA
jgi:glutamate/tyrosine decarboxylase-like PLP-dependent enzyme